MVSEEENAQLRQRIKELESRHSLSDVKEFNTKELKKVKKEAKKHQRSHSVSLIEKQRIEDKLKQTKTKLKSVEEERDMLKERILGLEETTRGRSDSFDTEGYFQGLYKECMIELQKEKDDRHQEIVQLKSRLQNALEDLEESTEALKAVERSQKVREDAIIQGYEAILRDYKISSAGEEK